MRIARLGPDKFRKQAFGLSGLKVSSGLWLLLSLATGLAVECHPQASFLSSLLVPGLSFSLASSPPCHPRENDRS